MRPEVLLILGCFILGTVITYCWWATIRIDLFRLRLAEIRDELDAAVMLKGLSAHRGYIELRRGIGFLIEFAPLTSIPVLLVFLKLNRSSALLIHGGQEALREVVAFFDRLRIDAPPEIREAFKKVTVTTLIHVFLTPAILVVVASLLAFGKLHAVISKLIDLRYLYKTNDQLGAVVK